MNITKQSQNAGRLNVIPAIQQEPKILQKENKNEKELEESKEKLEVSEPLPSVRNTRLERQRKVDEYLLRRNKAGKQAFVDNLITQRRLLFNSEEMEGKSVPPYEDEIEQEAPRQLLSKERVAAIKSGAMIHVKCYSKKAIDLMKETIEDLIKAAKHLGEPIYNVIVHVLDDSFIQKSAVFVVSLYLCTNVKQMLASLVQFLLSVCPEIPIKEWMDYLWDKAQLLYENLSKSWKGQVEAESYADELRSLNAFLTRVHNSAFVGGVTNFVLQLVGRRVFREDVSSQLISLLGRPVKSTMLEMLTSVIELAAKIIGCYDHVKAGRPLNEYLFAERPYDVYIKKAKFLLNYEDRTYIGLPVPGQMCRKQFIIESQEMCELADNMLAKMAISDARYYHMKDVNDQLRSMSNKLRNTYFGQSRQAPFMLVLHGRPGIGKSKLLPHFCKLYSGVKNVEFSMDSIYDRVGEYWEQYDPFKHRFIHYSEVGNQHEMLVQKVGDTVLTEINSLVDDLPMHVNMAFTEKGKVMAFPDGVLIDTNNPRMHVDKLMHEPSAILRRGLWIEAIVRPEFRVEGGVGIDIDKSLAAGGNYLDRYTFVVTQYVTANVKSRAEVIYLEGIDELDTFLIEYFAVRINQMETIQKKINEGVLGMPCAAEIGVEREAPPQLVEAESGPAAELIPFDNFRFLLDTAYYAEVAKYGWFLLIAMLLYMGWHLFQFYKPFSHLSKLEGKYWKMPSKRDIIVYGIMIFFLMFYTSLSIVVLLATPFLKKFAMGQVIGGMAVSYLWKTSTSDVVDAWNSFRYAVTGKGVENPLTLGKWFRLVGVVSSVILVVRAVSKCLVSRFESESGTFNRVKDKQNLETYEELFCCGPSYKRIPINNSTQWNIMKSVKEVAVHKDKPITLYPKIMKNARRLQLHPSGYPTQQTFALGLCQDIILVNTHALVSVPLKASIALCGERSAHESYKDFVITEDCRLDLGNDLSLVRVYGQSYSSILKHLTSEGDKTERGEACFMKEPVYVTGQRNVAIKNKLTGEDFIVQNAFCYDFAQHNKGMCGLPLIIAHGRGSKIAGIHAAGANDFSNCFAAPIYREVISKGLQELHDRSPFIEVFSESFSYDFEIEEPSAKSPFRYELFSELEYYGKIEGPVHVNAKSRLQHEKERREICSFLENKFDFDRKVHYSIPAMKPFTKHGEYISPFNVNLRSMCITTPSINMQVAAKVVDVYTARILEGLKGRKLDPLNVETAVNGAIHDAFLRRINVATSGGFGFPGKKVQYLPFTAEEEDQIRGLSDELKERVESILSIYLKKRRGMLIYTAQLKDEPRPIEKVLKGKTRLFYMTPLDCLVISRMLFSPYHTCIVEKGEVFGAAIGINIHSEASDLVNSLLAMSNNIMEGDFSGFDKSLPLEIGLASATITYRVLKAMGYNEEAMLAVCGALSDSLFPLINLNNDLFMKPGLNPSGRYATAEENTQRVNIAMMMKWYSDIETKDSNFFDHVVARNYGDDVCAAVSDEVSNYFNNITFSKYCADNLGMTFTPAAKEGEHKKFVTVETMSFLKRSFRPSKLHDKRWVAPLDMDSIYRSLEWIKPHDTISDEEHRVATYTSALWELFLHCEDKLIYNEARTFLSSLLSDKFGGHKDAYYKELPSFDDVEARIFGESMDVESESGQHIDIDEKTMGILKEAPPMDADLDVQLAYYNGRISMIQSLMAQNRVANVVNYSLFEIMRVSQIWDDVAMHTTLATREVFLRELEDAKATVACLERRINQKKIRQIYAESGNFEDIHLFYSSMNMKRKTAAYNFVFGKCRRYGMGENTSDFHLVLAWLCNCYYNVLSDVPVDALTRVFTTFNKMEIDSFCQILEGALPEVKEDLRIAGRKAIALVKDTYPMEIESESGPKEITARDVLRGLVINCVVFVVYFLLAHFSALFAAWLAGVLGCLFNRFKMFVQQKFWQIAAELKNSLWAAYRCVRNDILKYVYNPPPRYQAFSKVVVPSEIDSDKALLDYAVYRAFRGLNNDELFFLRSMALKRWIDEKKEDTSAYYVMGYMGALETFLDKELDKGTVLPQAVWSEFIISLSTDDAETVLRYFDRVYAEDETLLVAKLVIEDFSERPLLLDDFEAKEHGFVRDGIDLLPLSAEAESGPVSEMKSGPITMSDKLENLTDIVGDEPDEKEAGLNSMKEGPGTLLPIDEFWMRPVELTAFSIAPGAKVNTGIKVWNLYTMDPSVRAKLRNYSYLRGKLKVRISVSGTPFHYASLLVSYQPYATRNRNISAHETALGFQAVAWRPLFLNYLSQARGATTIDVKSNKPIDITCPFISTKPMHRLRNESAAVLSDVTPFDDLENAGLLYIYSINALACASATPSNVYVQVVAWMEDVELGAPTATQMAITTESGAFDEFKAGPVENFASNAKEIADALVGVPAIGSLAKASSIVLGGVKGLAAHYGWSRPVKIDDVEWVHNQPFTNGAQAIGNSVAKRITMDPRQELTIDPSVTADEKDEMSIEYIAGILSYLTTFSWLDTSPPLATALWKSKVTPCLDTTHVGATQGVFFQPTAMSYVARMFYYWRGDITFTFQIVASAYHRGKIAVIYDTNIFQFALIDANYSTNKQFMKVVDIQQTQQFEVCVRWAYPRMYARVTGQGDTRDNWQSFTTNNSYEFCNGFIAVVPFTKLQSPDNSDIEINVFVKAENLELQQLGSDLPVKRLIVSESGDFLSGVKADCVALNESKQSNKDITHYHFGEKVVSLRSVLKRFVTHYISNTLANPAVDGNTFHAIGVIMPEPQPLYGPAVAGLLLTHFGYLRYAYLGMRGSIRKRVRVKTISNGVTDQIKTFITLRPPENTNARLEEWSTSEGAMLLRGTVSFMTHINSGIEFELPFYSNNLFVFSFADDMVGSNGTNDMETNWTRRYDFVQDAQSNGSAKNEYHEESAIGEDFGFLRFSGAPYYTV